MNQSQIVLRTKVLMSTDEIQSVTHQMPIKGSIFDLFQTLEPRKRLHNRGSNYRNDTDVKHPGKIPGKSIMDELCPANPVNELNANMNVSIVYASMTLSSFIICNILVCHQSLKKIISVIILDSNQRSNYCFVQISMHIFSVTQLQ